MMIVMNGAQYGRSVVVYAEIDTAVVDMDGVWNDVTKFGSPEDVAVWSRWYHHQSRLHGWPKVRYLLLESGHYVPSPVALNGEEVSRA